MSCYLCGKKKVSIEHSPPKCFFPKNQRKNLITVDSCKEHNEDTSLDDEYVKNILTMLIGGNSTSYKQFSEKTIKSFKRNSALLHTITEKKHPIEFNGVQTLALEIDRNRVNIIMRKIAYALFYHKYNQRWFRKLITATTHLKTLNFENDNFAKIIENIQLKHKPIYEGTNPKVFKFAFIQLDDNINNQFLRMKFYDGFEMWIIPDECSGESDPELNTIY